MINILFYLFSQEKLQEQDRVGITNQPDLGKLFCRAYYHLKEETLYVESKRFTKDKSIYFLQLFHVKISNPVIPMV